MSATTREAAKPADAADSGARRAVPRTAALPPVDAVATPQKLSWPNWVLKTVMAVTGSIWALFLSIHLVGNLKVYTGGEHFDTYALWLKHAFEPLFPYQGVLWIMRVVLIACLVSHIAAGLTLWTRGRKARGPIRAKRHGGYRSFSAWLMPITGVLILLFLGFHLMDLTLGAQPVATEAFQANTSEQAFAYQNLIASFQRPWSAAIYIGMMVFIAIHLSHGVVTVASDLGAMGQRLRALFVVLAGLVAVAILLGNASIPIAVQLGVLS